jgi:hypothetical protein
MGIWESVKRATKAIAQGDPPSRYFAGGKQIVCEHCGHGLFDEGAAQLNTAGMTFFGLDWANKTATTLMCDACGRIQWYAIRPERQ